MNSLAVDVKVHTDKSFCSYKYTARVNGQKIPALGGSGNVFKFRPNCNCSSVQVKPKLYSDSDSDTDTVPHNQKWPKIKSAPK